MRSYRGVTRLRLLAAGSALALSLHAMPAFAAEDDEGDTEADSAEIVVTATRQSEAISKVPISISAYDQETMDKQNVRRVEDVARLTPGLTFARSSGGNGNQSNISIRGITSSIASPTTGIYIDDTPVQMRAIGVTAVNSYPMIFDLERVEVLRGPQGTLFGASAMGGAVRFITPSPDLYDISAYARSEVAAIESGSLSYEAGAAIGGPLAEGTLAIRASAWMRHDGGWVDRVGPLLAGGYDATDREKNINEQDSQAFKFDLKWAPSDTVTVTPSFYYQRLKIHDPAIFFAKTSDTSELDYTTPNVLQLPTTDRFFLPSLLVELDLGGVELVSNTSYFDRRLDQVFDYTYQSAELNASLVPYITIPGQYESSVHIDTQKTFTQEVRLQSDNGGPFNWVVGGFYSRAKQFASQDIISPYFDALIQERTGGALSLEGIFGSALLPGGVFFRTNIDSVDEDISGFAQVDYSVTEKLKLTAGVRVSSTSYTADILRDGPLAGGYSLTTFEQDESPVTPKFAISYQADPSLLIYASAAKGFRSGGAQAHVSPIACATDLAALGLTESPGTYKSDSLWSYEIGLKKRAGNLFSLETSAYIIKWKDFLDNVVLPSCGGRFFNNVGEVTSKGFDIAATLRPTTGLTLTTALGYTEASFDDTVYRVEPAILRTKGSRLSVPPLTVSVSGEYEFPLSDSADGYVRADFQHVAEGPQPAATDYGFDPMRDPLPEVNNLDLRFGGRFSGVDLSMFVANVLNDKAIQYFRSSTKATLYQAVAPRPRTFGITATFHY